jgi:hypothetical protein
MKFLQGAVAIALFAGLSIAEPIPNLAARDAPTVDLGYSVYSGKYDVNNSINAFLGYVPVQLENIKACN